LLEGIEIQRSIFCGMWRISVVNLVTV